MVTDEQRGRYGRWLRRERLHRGWSVDEALARLARGGYRIGESSYAEWESGRKRPSKDALPHLIGLYGEPDPEPEAAPAGSAAPAMGDLVSALTGLVMEMRRQNDRASEAQAQMADSLAVLTEEVRELREALRAHVGAAGPHGAPTPDAGGVPPAPPGGHRKSQAAVR